jgi:hypothetical protein
LLPSVKAFDEVDKQFIIFRQATKAVRPTERSLDNPTLQLNEDRR